MFISGIVLLVMCLLFYVAYAYGKNKVDVVGTILCALIGVILIILSFK